MGALAVRRVAELRRKALPHFELLERLFGRLELVYRSVRGPHRDLSFLHVDLHYLAFYFRREPHGITVGQLDLCERGPRPTA